MEKGFDTKYTQKTKNIHNIQVGDKVINYCYNYNTKTNTEKIDEESFIVTDIKDISFNGFIKVENEKIIDQIQYFKIRNWHINKYYDESIYEACIILKENDNIADYLPYLKERISEDIENKINILKKSLNILKERY